MKRERKAVVGTKALALAAAAVAVSSGGAAFGQSVISYTGVGNLYLQNFDGLGIATGSQVSASASWSDGATIPGWYAAGGSTPGPKTTYLASDGSSNTGQMFSFGTNDTTDRALGSVGSTNATNAVVIYYGMKLVNNTGVTLDKFTISYTGEEWRATSGSQGTLFFGYSTSASNVYDSGFSTAPSLDFLAPVYGTAVTADGKVNGNTGSYRTSITATVPIVGGWGPNQTLIVRWSDPDTTGGDQGLGIDDLSFSAAAAATTNNHSTLTVGGSKAPSTVLDLGRVVYGNTSGGAGVAVHNAGPDATTYSDQSPDGATLTPGTGSVAAGADATVTVKIAAGALPQSAVGTDVTRTAVIKNDGNSDDANIQVQAKVHVLTDRFVNTTESSQGVDFGKMLVGASKTATVTLTTTNSGDKTSASLPALALPAAATADGVTVNDAYAHVAMAAGTTDALFSDGTETTQRDVTLSPLKSGSVVQGGGTGLRSVNYLTYGLTVADGTVGASTAGRIYVKGDFYRPALVTGDATPVGPGGVVTLTNALPPGGDGSPGKRLGAQVTGVSIDQSGWTLSGIDTSTVVQPTTGTSGSAAMTATGTVAFDGSGKLNGVYGATATIAMQNADQTVYGTAANDLPAVLESLTATVGDKPAVQSASYSLNGGTLVAPATTLSGTFTQTGGSSTFASVVGGGTVVVAGGSMTLSTGTAANVVKALTVSGTGTVDLTSGKLAIDYAGSTVADAVRGQLQAGLGTGAWDGTSGITTSAGKGNAAKTTGIGYAEASQVVGAGGGTWAGVGVDGTALLLKYTYFGDANLDGKVDGSDYTLLDKGFNKHVANAHWTDGDFNYDGSVTTADYLLADTAFGQQGGGVLSPEFLAARQLQFGDAYVANLITAVPEPTSLGLVGVAAAGLLGRRRRSVK